MNPAELHAAALALALDRGDRATFDRLAAMSLDDFAALLPTDDPPPAE